MGTFYDDLRFSPRDPDLSETYHPPKEGLEQLDFLGPAFRESLSPFAVKRMSERESSLFQEGTPFKVDDKVNEELNKNYTPDEGKYLSESKTESEFLARKRFIQEDRDRLSSIGEAGGKGIVATLAFSLIDPVSLGLGAVSGGLGIGAKSAGVARALKVAAVSGIENAAVETLLMKGSTQSSYTDVLSAFAMGSVIGGGLSPFMRSAHPEIAREADAADAALRMDTDMEISHEVLSAVQDTRPRSEVDMRTVMDKLSAHEQRLTVESESAINRGRARQLQKEIDELVSITGVEQENIKIAKSSLLSEHEAVQLKKAEYTAEVPKAKKAIHELYAPQIAAQEKKIAPLSKGKGGKNTSKKLWKAEEDLKVLETERSMEIKKVESKFEKRIKASENSLSRKMEAATREINLRRVGLEESINERKVALEKGLKSRTAQNELSRWSKLSEEERIKEVFKDDPLPLRQAELSKQSEGAKSTTEQMKTAEVESSSLTQETPEFAVGAMRAGEFEAPLHTQYDIPQAYQDAWLRMATDGLNIPDDLRGLEFLGRSEFSKKVYSASTALMNSNDYAIRGFAWHLFDSPQGGSQNSATVAARVRNWQNMIRSAKKNRINEGMDEWAREIGVPEWKVPMTPALFTDFHKKVIQEVKNPGTYDSPSIIKAAEGVRDQLKKAGQIRKDAGEAGFENIDLDKNYFPTILAENNIKSALVNPKYGPQKVKDLISLSYQQGHFKLKKDVADTLADSYIERVRNHSLTMRDYVSTSVQSKDMEKIADSLRKAGVSDDVISEMLDTSLEKEIKQHMSDRAKKSLYPDVNAELGGLRMIDLIDSDVPKLLESYTRASAGGAAFAKLGFKTKQQVMKFIEFLEKTSRNNGRDERVIRREIQTLKDGVELAYGRTLNEDAHKPLVQWLSRLRDLTGLLRLQFVGVASIPESARLTVNRGLNTVLRECKDLGAISGSKAFRESGKFSGKFNRPDLDEIEEVMGYIGEDHVLYDKGLRYDAFEDSEFGSRFGAAMDKMLAQGRRVAEIASGFRLVQGSLEKLSVRSLAYQIKKWALSDAGSIKGLRESEIKRAGWYEDNFLDQLKEWMNDNPKTELYKGRQIDLFNFGEMPAEMQERLQIGMHRIVASDIQRPLLGETPMYMHRWLGQTLTQFRGFSILSLEKQLLHDVRHDRIAGSLIALHSIAFSYMALGIQVLHNSIGREDKDDYVKNQMSGRNLSVGLFNRMGQVASAGIALDFLATLGMLPSELSAAPAHPGGRVLSGSSVPVFGVAGDSFDALRTVMDAAFGRDTDSDGEDREKAGASDVVKAMHKILPGAKTIGVHQGFNALESALKE